MTEANREMFTKALIDCYDYHDKPVNEKTMDLYFRLLEPYSLESVLKGLESVLRSSKFFPKVSEIIEQIEGNEDEHIDIAYQDIKKIIYTGFHYALRLNNPITMAVVDSMGGQESFYNAVYVDKHDDTAAYFEFKRLYKIYLRHFKETGELPKVQYLPGYMDKLAGASPVLASSLKPVGIGFGKQQVMIGAGQ